VLIASPRNQAFIAAFTASAVIGSERMTASHCLGGCALTGQAPVDTQRDRVPNLEASNLELLAENKFSKCVCALRQRHARKIRCAE
jgi:hypothetical protein